MKSKLFKKIVATTSAVAMLGTMGITVPMSASAKSVSLSFDFEDGNKVFTDDSRITGAIEKDATLNSNVVGFTCAGNAQNGYSFAHYSFADSVLGATQTKVEFDYYNTNGGRAILSLGDAGVRGNNGGSSKATYNPTGVAFNLGSDKSNSIVQNVKGDLNDVTNKWMHVSVTVDEIANTLSYKIADMAGATIEEAENVDFLSSDAVSVSQIDIFGYINNSHCAMIDNLQVSAELSDAAMYDVTYDVDGKTSTETVTEGNSPTKVPAETAKLGYLFKGWTTDGDAAYDAEKTYFTSEQVLASKVTAAVTYTAVYEKDADYIEEMSSIEFSTFPANGILVAGTDADTAESNLFAVKIIGELGTNLSETPDSRVTDYDVKYELKGFRWVALKNEATTDPADSNTYCDSYGSLVITDKTADFQLKSHPFNYYGQITATVTYNGKTLTVSKPLAYIGNPAKPSANEVLPRGGYISDFNAYSPDMVGYEAAISPNNVSATDVTTDNWAAYGGNIKTLKIAEEEGNKFLKLNALGTSSSCFAANQIEAVTDGQLIFDQMLRFNNAGSAILLKSANPVTWNDNATSVTVNFTGTGFAVNGETETFAEATTGVWYRVVVSSDVTSKKFFVKIYSADNQLIGESEIVNFTNAGSINPTYYMYRLPDRAKGELDFNDVKIYRATIDQASMETTATSTTLAIPEAGAAATTADLTVSAKTTEGYEAIGAATWTVADDAQGITVVPSAEDSHMATVNVTSEASAGTATINVTVGGITKSIDLTISSSQDSIKFATPVINSISIPMDDKNETVTYAASVIDKDGNDIAGKNVTFALYDKNNTNPTTVEGVTFENGVLTVSKNAKPCVVTVRATSTNSNNEEITNSVRVTIHGLAFDFGAGTDEDVVSGYTAITPTTSYSDKLGYGIEGSTTVSGTASLEDADTDALDGTFTFKAKVTNDKLYKVIINYVGTAAFENMSTDLSGVVRSNPAKNTVEYQTFVHDGVLDITFSNVTVDDKPVTASVSSITIEKIDDKTPGAKPNVYTVGDSTIANNGSWAYVLNRDQGNYPELGALATFSNNGRGGKNLSSYYTGGELWDRVVTNIRPGDYVMIGDMGTNGMGTDFRGSFTYYVDACLAMGAKVILNSYSPHLAVGSYAGCYDSSTQTFTGYRQDAYDNIVREIYTERSNEFAGFIDIGKNSDKAFNAYVDDYAANGYASRDAAAQAIIACAGSPGQAPDHNHYGNGTIACQLMIEGYNGTPGIVSELVRVLSSEPVDPTPTPTATATTDPTPTATATTDPTPTATADPGMTTVYAADAVVVAALYDANGALTAIESITPVKENQEVLEFPADVAGQKVFVWDSLENMKPVGTKQIPVTTDPAETENPGEEATEDPGEEVTPDPEKEAKVIWKAAQNTEYTAGQVLADGLELVFGTAEGATPVYADFTVSDIDKTPTTKLIDGVLFTGYVSAISANGSWSGESIDPAKPTAIKYTASKTGVLTVYLDSVGTTKKICVGQEGDKKTEIEAAATMGTGEAMAFEYGVTAGQSYYIYVAGSKGRFCGVAFDENGEVEPPATEPPSESEIPAPKENEWTMSADYLNGCVAGTELMVGLTTVFDNTSTNKVYLSGGENGKLSEGIATGTALKYVASKNGKLAVSFVDLGTPSSDGSPKTMYIVEEGGKQSAPVATVANESTTDKMNGTIEANVEAGKTYYIYGAGTKARFSGATFTAE